MRLLAFLGRTVDKLNLATGKLVAFLMVPMLLVMILEVIMRYGFKSPTLWGTEMATFIFAGYVLLGAGYTHLQDGHVNMNALYQRLARKNKAIFDLITSTAFFLYCGVLLYESCRFTWDAMISGRHTGTDWNPPLAPVLITMPIGVFLMLLQGIVKFVRDLNTVVSGKGSST
jgi:TRAP-type mannitol/chloroaromatic compound transport system permease small subunit